MKVINLTLVLWTLLSFTARAATLAPIVDQEALGATLSEIALPATIARDLTSGFENRLLIRVLLISQTESIARADAMVTVKYDLWEERYIVRRILGGRVIDESVVKQVQDAAKALSTLRLDRLFLLSSLPKERDLTLQAELLINPIERDKLDRLREWVATNSAPRDAVGGGAAFTPRPNDLFNRIFEQYTSGADVAAPWRLTVVSQPFRPARLRGDAGE